MLIPCKQILWGLIFCLVNFTMPLAADEPDELLKLLIQAYPENMVSAAKWRNMLNFKYQFGVFPRVYGSASDFDNLRTLHNAAEQKFEAALGPPIIALDYEYVPTAERIKEAKAKSAKVIEELFDEFGRDKFLRAVQFQNLIHLRGIVNHFKINDPSFMTIPGFRERMNLTAEQRSTLEEIDLEYKQTVLQHLEHLFVTIRDINSDKLSRIKSELSPEQKTLASRLIGSPLNWTRLLSTNEESEIRTMIGERKRETMEVDGYRVLLPEGCDLNIRHFRELKLTPDYNEDELKWPHFDSLLATLLSSDFVAKEMELSDDQQAEIKEFITEVRETSIVSAKFAKERLERLLDGSAKFPPELERILVPLQMDWLRQAELQFFTGDSRSTFGITHPIMVRRLEMSNGTVNKIEEVASEFNEPISQNVSMAETELAKIGFEYGQKRIEVLKQKDRERFQLLTGVNCDRLEELMEAIVEPSRVKTKYSLN